jgi:hypothetical protein
MDFVFMLTREDQTVSDCLGAVEAVAGAGLRHIGFKDVGVDAETVGSLHDAIKQSGATSYLEVVSTTRERALASAEVARRLGVDYLLGGTWVEPTLERLSGTATAYLPFPGRPEGHPTRLFGSPKEIADDCRRFERAGCAGVDLLAYRATDSGPLELVRAARSALTGRLLVAGSINSAAQIRDLADAGVDAFTIGSAVFAGQLDSRGGLITTQLAAVERMLAELD